LQFKKKKSATVESTTALEYEKRKQKKKKGTSVDYHLMLLSVGRFNTIPFLIVMTAQVEVLKAGPAETVKTGFCAI
jgi:hypothetical protein